MDDYNRREFIKTTVPGWLGVMLSLPSLCALATRANACEGRIKADRSIHWEAFLEAVAKEAAKQHLDRWNEEEYLKKVSKLTRTLYLDDPVISSAMGKITECLKLGNVDFKDLETRVDFAVCLVQFDVNEVIRPHNHPGMTGVILCASGEIQTQNYDLHKTLEDREVDGVRTGKYLLRRSRNSTLRKGDVSTLTSQARNIHSLQARAVTQLIDIFTPPYNKERSEKSCWYELDEVPITGSRTLYEAHLCM